MSSNDNDKLDLGVWADAERYLRENTKSIECTIYPSQFAIMGPALMQRRNVQLNMANCNHNTPNATKMMEIINNLLGNPMEAENTHSRNLGMDAELLVFRWDKVRSRHPNYHDLQT